MSQSNQSAEWDFECVWRKLVNMEFKSLKEAHRYSYLAGRGALAFQESAELSRLTANNLDNCGAETQKEIV